MLVRLTSIPMHIYAMSLFSVSQEVPVNSQARCTFPPTPNQNLCFLKTIKRLGWVLSANVSSQFFQTFCVLAPSCVMMHCVSISWEPELF